MRITREFEEFCWDYDGIDPALMSDEELKKALKSFESMSKKPERVAAHPDMKLPVSELRARCARLVCGLERSISKHSGKAAFATAIAAGQYALDEGRRIMSAKRATKAEMIAHKEQTSAADRLFNAAVQNEKM